MSISEPLFFQCYNCGKEAPNWGKVFYWEERSVCNTCYKELQLEKMKNTDKISGYLVNYGVEIGDLHFSCKYKVKNLKRAAIDGFPMRNTHITFQDANNQLWSGVCWNSDWNQAVTFRKVK